MTTIAYTGVLEVTSCWCGIRLAIPASRSAKAHENGLSIYCPLGHRFSWRETKADKLAKELASQRAYSVRIANERDAIERKLTAQKGANTKLRKRVGNGVCPCCHRSFVQLAKHMKTKHPEYPAAGA